MNRARVVGLIVLVAYTVLFLLIGIGAGLYQKGFAMFIFFFMTVYFVVLCTSALMSLKIDTCFNRLEELISKKSNSFQPITTAPERKGVRRVDKMIQKKVWILDFILTPSFVGLGMFFAIFRHDWFWMSVFMLACIISHIIFSEVLIALKIDACYKRVEELISSGNEGQTSTEQPGE